MKIAFITPSVSRSAGGIFEIELALAQAINKGGNPVIVFGQRDENTFEDLQKWAPVKVNVFSSFGPHAFRYSPLLKKTLIKSDCDIAHLHVIWMYTSMVVNSWFKTKRPYIITINGMLEPWALANAGWKKKLVRLFYEDRCLQNASCIHANTYKEYLDIRSFGLKNPICIIPNGVNLSNDTPTTTNPSWFYQVGNKKILLFLSRLHPKKGLENLITAWSFISSKHNDWCLVIAGWGSEEYSNILQERTNELQQQQNILFIGAQFDKDKQSTFACASAFILPSLSEGLPMAILEAWAYQLPVLCTKACNLPEGFEQNAALEIESSPTGIAEGLNNFFSLTENERLQMGKNGLRLVTEKFTWGKIGSQLTDVYKWVLNGGQPPETVLLD